MKSIRACFALFGFLFSIQSGAFTQPATNQEEFCSRAADPDYFKNLILDQGNQISFTNGPYGIANGGVCWWHSRLQRNATYLTVYRPDLPKATEAQATAIISALTKGEALSSRKIIEIPGYRNFSEFTADWQHKIIRRLEKWQVAEGVWGADWLTRGMKGSDKVSAENLRKKMDELYPLVNDKKEVVFQMLQMPGVVAHAWLVVHMSKTRNGYRLQVVDSNYHGSQTWDYEYGMEFFHYSGVGSFVPYTDRMKELKLIDKAISQYCKSGVKEKLPASDVRELDLASQ